MAVPVFIGITGMNKCLLDQLLIMNGYADALQPFRNFQIAFPLSQSN
jgi:hypothetical protein